MSMKMTLAEFIGLEPCPFCGGEAETHEVGFPYHYWDIYCDGECFDHFCEKPTEAEAIKAWNTRADDRSQAAAYWQRAYEETVRERTCKREEIVRCRDCEFFVRDKLGECCTLMDFERVGGMADGFCAWGEKKEASE